MRFAPYIAFLLSGASSLIFQSIWTRMLHHVFGATSIAISTVLTGFMAGLGLGTWISGRYANRIKHPIFAYAIAEFFVAVWGLIIPFLVDSEGWLASVNAWLRQSLGAESGTFMIARFLCVVPILLIPTTLMGSTFPLLTRHFVLSGDDAETASGKVGVLYAINTLGAALGPLLSAFILLPNVGLSITNIVACSMNLSLAAMIFALREPLIGSKWGSGVPLSVLPGKEDIAPEANAPAEQKAPEKAATEKPTSEKKSKAEAKKQEASKDDAGKSEKKLVDTETWIPPAARIMSLVGFGVSGAAALCYENVWSRALAMTIGSSIYSFALILETFLVGIAVGSAAMSAFLGKGKRPALGVGLTTIALTLLGNVSWAIDMRRASGVNEGSIVTWLSVSVLPVLLIIGLWQYSQFLAARLRAIATATDEVVEGDSVTAPTLVMTLVPITVSVLNLAYFQEGYLPKIVASVVTTIAVFLAATIWYRRSPVLLLAIVQLFIGLATVVSYFWQDEIPYAFAQLVTSIGTENLPDNVRLVQFFMFITAGLCTVPSTLGMGAMFPLAVRVWTAGGDGIAKDVAVVYTANTIGSLIGSWVPGFILMPLLGMEYTLQIGIGLNLIVALAMLIAGATEPDEKEGRELPTWHVVTVYVLAPLIPALLALLYLGTSRPDALLRWNQTQMTLGVFRVSLAEGMLDPNSWGQPDLVYYHDGISTTVTVERWGRHYALKNNGKVDASNGDDMPTQITVAAYPLLMHSRGAIDLDVAVVGFGSGVSVGTTLSFPVRRVDVIELERAIPEAARFFEDVNLLDYNLDHYPFVEMDRLSIINDDGRNFLAATDQSYDVIISEPSNPWITGVSDLFTVDHFRIAKRRLRPDGIYCQWVQLYEMSPENIKTIFRTFASVYRHVMVLAADEHSSDTVVLGSDAPLPFDLERMRAGWQLSTPGRMSVADQLERSRMTSPFDLMARVLLANRDEVMTYSQIEERERGGRWEVDYASTNVRTCEAPGCRRRPAILNTDDNARIELAAPQDLIGFQRYEGYLNTVYSHEWPFARFEGDLENFGEGDARAQNLAELALSLIGHGRHELAAEFIVQSERAGRARETAVAAEVLAHLASGEREPSIRIEAPIPGPEMDRRTAEQLVSGFDRVRESVDRGQFGAALQAMEAIPSPIRLHSGPSMRFLYAYLLFKASSGSFSQSRAAAEALEELVRSDEEYVSRHPEAFYFLARSLDGEGETGQALPYMRRYVEARLVVSPSDAVPEPPASEAPASDAAGESDKTGHDPATIAAPSTP